MEIKKIGIYSATKNSDLGNFDENLEVNDKPGFIAIGFISSHWPGSPEEPFGFVGYIITNSEDDGGSTETLAWIDYDNNHHYVWVLGDLAIDDDGMNHSEMFEKCYPLEFARIKELIWQYFKWESDEDNCHLIVAKKIPDELRLSKLYAGNDIDLEDVKKSNGGFLGHYISF